MYVYGKTCFSTLVGVRWDGGPGTTCRNDAEKRAGAM